MPKDRKDVQDYFNQEAASYHDDTYDLNSELYPANYFRMKIVIDVLEKRKDIRKILDVGCGGCEPMVALLKRGYDVVGIDFSDEMLRQGKARLAQNGFDAGLVRKMDFLNAESLLKEEYDAVLMLGVVGYNKDDDLTMANVSRALRPGGITLVEFPNQLFSFASFNSYSIELFMNVLWGSAAMPEKLKSGMDAFLQQRFDQNIARDKYAEKKKCLGSDVPYPTYNPLTIQTLFERHAMRLNTNHFYHFHALPPIWEYKEPATFKQLSMSLEKADDWRGHFLCSAFLSEGQKTSER
jgi:SAM-dependent methyltransferase